MQKHVSRGLELRLQDQLVVCGAELSSHTTEHVLVSLPIVHKVIMRSYLVFPPFLEGYVFPLSNSACSSSTAQLPSSDHCEM